MCNAKTSKRTVNAKTKELAKKIKGDGFENIKAKQKEIPDAQPGIVKNQKGFTVHL